MRLVMKKISLVIVVVVLMLSCTSNEEKLTNQANMVIKKVESFKKKTGALPTSLRDIGEPYRENGPLFYEIIDSGSYIVHFGIGLGESKVYESDKKAWTQR